MGEKLTLSEIDKAAKDSYSQYRVNHFDKVEAEQRLANPPSVDDLRINKLPFEREKKFQARMGKFIADWSVSEPKIIDRTSAAEERVLSDAKTFAQENAGDLYDLALIQANLDGVSINTENPIQIGQHVSAQTTEQHSQPK